MSGAVLGRRAGRIVIVYEHLGDEIPLEYHAIRTAFLALRAGWDVHIVCRGTQPSPRPRDGATLWWERSPAAVLRRVLTLRPEVVFVDNAVQGLPAALFAKTWVRAAIASDNPVKQALMRRLLARAKAVSFTNPAAIAGWEGLHLRLTDLPYPLDVGWWGDVPPRRRELWEAMGAEVPPGPVLTFVANIIPRKRHAELVTALGPVLRERSDLRLVLIGRGYREGAGPQARADAPDAERALDDACREAGVEQQVIRTGWQPPEAVREIFGWTTAQIINSEFETQCMGLYEGLAAGVPALISDIAPLTSAFPALPHHATAAELATNVAALLGQPARGAELVAACRERVAWADMARHDALFYETMSRLAGRPVRATTA